MEEEERTPPKPHNPTENPALSRAQAMRYAGGVEAGDCLYLPALWTHQVR